jgi:hypothetical protein
MKFLISVILFFSSANVWAQDVIITQNGESKIVWGLEVSSTSVFFREKEEVDAPIKKMNKNELLMIKYQNGTKLIIDDGHKTATNSSNSFAAENSYVEDAGANALALKRMSDYNVSFNGKDSNDASDMLYCMCLPKQNSVFADKNIEMNISSEDRTFFNGNKKYPTPYDCNILITLKNKTTKTLYLDLGNTFFISGQSAYAFYVPSSVSQTSGKTTGVSVNLGAVAGAFGVKGGLGTLANGIGVGESNSHFTTTTTYSQRVIAVPPMSKKILDAVSLFPKGSNLLNENLKRSGHVHFLTMYLPKNSMIKIGEVRTFGEDNEMACFGVFVTYATDENITQPHNVHASYYLQKIIGTKAAHKLDQKYFDIESITNFMRPVHFYTLQKKAKN